MDKHPKVLFFDIETSPILGYVWQLWENNVALNQIESDWHLLSWAARWLGNKKMMYADQRDKKDISNDKSILKGIWNLLDEADIVVTQNGKKFDEKKLNARFILNGMKPPSSYKHIDICQIAKNKFGFTSNKLEYLTDKLCKKNKKSDHKKFPGFELWKACLKGDKTAWNEMEKYNKLDVTSLEELYHIIIPWDTSINFNLYSDDPINVCKCGCTKVHKKGYAYTAVGKYQRYKCAKCGAEARGRKNLFSNKKKESLKVRIS